MKTLEEAMKEDEDLRHLVEAYGEDAFVFSERWGFWVLERGNPYL